MQIHTGKTQDLAWRKRLLDIIQINFRSHQPEHLNWLMAEENIWLDLNSYKRSVMDDPIRRSAF
jgi:hypothetical protein